MSNNYMIHEENTTIIDIAFKKLVDDILDGSPDYVGTFNTKDLPDLHNYDAVKVPNILLEMRTFFEKLELIKHHSLYYFELKDVDSAQRVKALLDGHRKPKKKQKAGYRVVLATNTYDNTNSTILYLGVRRGAPNKSGLTHLAGRINQHLGYYKNGSTQGLQLHHYARGLDFEITLKVYEFQKLDSNYLNVIEKMMAKKLNPLCGRH
jgi:hypothetical protein